MCERQQTIILRSRALGSETGAQLFTTRVILFSFLYLLCINLVFCKVAIILIITIQRLRAFYMITRITIFYPQNNIIILT